MLQELTFIKRPKDKLKLKVIQKTKPRNKIKMCCDTPNLIEDILLVCTNCGFTFNAIINTNSEVINYKSEQTITNNQSNQRCSKTQNGFQEYALGTNVGVKNKSVLTQRQKVVLELNNHYSKFEQFGANENIINNAIDTFLKLSGHDSYQKKSRHIFKGKRRLAMIAICLDYSFQKFDCERLVADICKVFDFTKRVYFKEVERFNYICKTIQLPLYEIRCDTDQMIFNYINHLQLPREILKFTILLYKSVIDLKIIKDLKPKSIICGVIYCILIAFGKVQRALEIPIVLDITKSTLDNFKKTFDRYTMITLTENTPKNAQDLLKVSFLSCNKINF